MKNPKKKGFTVSFAHYPLLCSSSAANCKNDKTLLKDYFDLMFDNKVNLYIGAHHHTYERIYPYYQDGTIKKISSPYYSNETYLLSIVEAVPGNDKSIVESYDTILDFTASYTFNQTGFGVLSANE